jgi:hypothetical protein
MPEPTEGPNPARGSNPEQARKADMRSPDTIESVQDLVL